CTLAGKQPSHALPRGGQRSTTQLFTPPVTDRSLSVTDSGGSGLPSLKSPAVLEHHRTVPRHLARAIVIRFKNADLQSVIYQISFCIAHIEPHPDEVITWSQR